MSTHDILQIIDHVGGWLLAILTALLILGGL